MSHFETRPTAAEHAPYYTKYLALVPEGDLLTILRGQGAATQALLAGLDDIRALSRYAPGKWSVKEIVGHVTDSERVFAYRALRIGRGDATPLPSFEHDDYVKVGGFDQRPIAELAAELAAVRAATLPLLASFDASAWLRIGTASGHPVSVRALAAITAGHERHHVGILREKYGLATKL
jgi:hypothetical protein